MKWVTFVILISFSCQTYAQNQRSEKDTKRLLRNMRRYKDIREYDLCIDDTTQLPKSLGKRPQFPGGSVCLNNFIKDNIQVPASFIPDAEVEFNNLSVDLSLDSSGKIINYRIITPLSSCTSCDTEAIRLIKLMPDWIPAQGEKIGEVVHNIPSQQIISINFTPGYYNDIPNCESMNKQ